MTPELWSLLYSQLLQVSSVALITWLLVRLLAKDRPHLAHSLWALVLLKCITPPIVASPTGVFTWLNQAVAADNRLDVEFSVSKKVGSEESPVDVPALATLETRRYYIDLNQLDAQSESSNGFGVFAPLASAWKAAKEFAVNNMLFVFWLSGSLVVGIAMLWRLARFLRKVRRLRASVQNCRVANDRLRRLSKGLSKRLGLQRNVDVAVIDSAIGPAIVGLLRPCILLPKVIVDQASHADLKALIAHELVHFRRGDLWWSTLQACALAVSWCNPMIWFASRKFTQEAEKCCDEETVASLGLDPAGYARCLISVLEKKHTLRAAPLLPGVRPVDVTAKRLERIMRFGQGSRSRSPRWVALVLLAGAAAILPGAATVAQEDSDLKTASEASSPSVATPVAATGEKIDFIASINSSNLAQLGYQFNVYSSEEALAKLVEEGKDPQVAMAKLQAMLPRGAHWTSAQATTKHGLTLEFQDEDGKPVKLGGSNPAILVTKSKVYALGTNSDHEQVKATLHRVANHGVAQLKFQIRIVEIPTAEAKTFIQDWELVGKVVEKQEKGVVAASYTVDAAEVFETRKSSALSDCEVKELLDAGGNGTALAAPTLIGLNGMPVEMMMGGEVPYVSSFNPVEDENGNKTSTMQPVIGFAKTGIILKLTGVLDEESEAVDLSLDYTQAELKGMDTFTFESGSDALTVQQPILAQTKVVTHEKMPVNQTIAICGGARAREVRSEKRVPILSKVPYVGRLFKSKAISREMVSTIILVECSQVTTGEVISDGEEYAAPQASPVEQSYRLEPLPAAPSATVVPAVGKPLPLLKSSSKSKTSKPVLVDEVRHERYERFPLMGPITSGKSDKIDLPTDREVLQVLENNSNFEAKAGVDYKIVKQKIADYIDPPRFVPLIGNAALRHQHYKCTIYEGSENVVEVAYIDHKHFHMKGESQAKPAAKAEKTAAEKAVKDSPKTEKAIKLGGTVTSDLGVEGVLIVDEFKLSGDDETFNFYMGFNR